MVTLISKNSDGVDVGFLELDATPSETHVYESRPTNYPVETGVLITDHIRREPEQLRLDGFITNSPTDLATPAVPFTSDLAQLAFDFLEEVYKERHLVDVVTRFKTYFDMAMSRLSIPRTNRTGDALAFSCSFVRIVKVSTELVTAPNLSTATSGPAGGTNKQATTDVKKGKQPVPDSALYDLGQVAGFIPQ